MNILYIADSSSWHNAKWTEYFAKNSNTILFSDFKENYKPVTFHKNVKIIQLPPLVKTKNRHFNKVISIIYYAFHISKIIKKYDIEIIHCVAIYYGFLSTFIKTEKPIIYTQQGSELLVKAKNNWFYSYMAKRVFKRVDIVTGDSKILQKAGMKYGAHSNNNYIIQNGVDLRTFNSPKKNTVSFIENRKIMKLFSPRGITPLYNIDVIITALDILQRKHSLNFFCQFVYGFGDEYLIDYKKKCQILKLSANIEWIGYVDHKDMPNYYIRNDITISVPSSDSSPKSVYESMACGTPVVISDLEWSRENLINGKNVITCKAGSASDLADSIIKLYNDKVLYDDIKKSGIELVKERFSYIKEMEKMKKIMLKAIEMKKSNT